MCVLRSINIVVNLRESLMRESLMRGITAFTTVRISDGWNIFLSTRHGLVSPELQPDGNGWISEARAIN